MKVLITENLKNLNQELEFRQFTGTQKWYKTAFNEFYYTDGIYYLAKKYQAYWLLDIILSHQGEIRQLPFQIWEIWSQDNQAVVTMREDDGEPMRVRQDINFTDFPDGYMKLYLIDKILLLPSEY